MPSTRPAFPHISKSFVQSTRKNRKTKKSNTPRPSLLDTANDWMMLVDYDKNKIVFPPMICATSQRPDIVIWSSMARTVIIIELTCPAEEGIQAAAIRKESRYASLLAQIEETKSWSGQLLTIEIGARGLVSSRVFNDFRKLGLSAANSRILCHML